MKHSGLRFQHYKNHKFYDHISEAKWLGSFSRPDWEFAGEGTHTETKEALQIYMKAGKYEYLSPTDLGTLTIYQADYDDPTHGDKAVWTRPEEMFWGDVEIEEDEFVSRFRLVQ